MKYTVLELQTTANAVSVDDTYVRVRLNDGREIAFPWAKNQRLASASPTDRGEVELICGGTGLHWPRLDEDLSLIGILEGRFSASR